MTPPIRAGIKRTAEAAARSVPGIEGAHAAGTEVFVPDHPRLEVMSGLGGAEIRERPGQAGVDR
jgi:hypothetical protein